MNTILKILFALFLAGVFYGIYLNTQGDDFHHQVFGISILFFSLIVMPLFIYHRYQQGKYKKYVLDPKSKNPFKIDEDKLK